MTDPGRAGAVVRVARVFDSAADDYDQSGVPFFGPIAVRLCDLAAPKPGERVLDVGCGRGAVTLRVAERVGPSGSVTAVDVSAAMTEHTRVAADRAGLSNVRVEALDANAPALPEQGFDLLTASLVLFFLPDPADGLAQWMRCLGPGGRIALTTFGEQDPTWRTVDALFAPYLPPQLLDPRTRGAQSPLASDQGVESLLRDAGATDVRTVREPFIVRFDDAEQWRAWSMGTGQRAFWGFVPEAERGPLFTEAAALLARNQDADGRLVVQQEVRYSVASA